MRRHFFRHIGCPAAQATHVLCCQATGYTGNTTICRSSTDSAITHRLTRFCQQIIKMSCKIELLAGHLSGKYSVLASLVFVLWSTEFPVRNEKCLTCFTSSLDNYPICIVKFGGDYIYTTPPNSVWPQIDNITVTFKYACIYRKSYLPSPQIFTISHLPKFLGPISHIPLGFGPILPSPPIRVTHPCVCVCL